MSLICSYVEYKSIANVFAKQCFLSTIGVSAIHYVYVFMCSLFSFHDNKLRLPIKVGFRQAKNDFNGSSHQTYLRSILSTNSYNMVASISSVSGHENQLRELDNTLANDKNGR